MNICNVTNQNGNRNQSSDQRVYKCCIPANWWKKKWSDDRFIKQELLTERIFRIAHRYTDNFKTSNSFSTWCSTAGLDFLLLPKVYTKTKVKKPCKLAANYGWKFVRTVFNRFYVCLAYGQREYTFLFAGYWLRHVHYKPIKRYSWKLKRYR